MRIALYSRGSTAEVEQELQRAGLDYVVRPDDCEGVDVAVSWGGDGTFLDCVRHFGSRGLPVLGINSGRLGFLANVPREGMGQAFDDLREGRWTTVPRSLIEVGGSYPARPDYPFAFNDFSIQRGDAAMIAVEAWVDGEIVATYWGDGAILSTPAGSTAYSLSVGGPIVVPGCECFVLSPIAPHNLTMRPVVIPDRCEVTFRVSTRDRYAYAAFDGSRYEVPGGESFRLRKAANGIFLVQLQNISFYDTLRNKMLWGVDQREGKGGSEN